MPFYLVTQTVLVEAEDTAEAAHKVLSQIREADTVSFTVRSDEQTIAQVSIIASGNRPGEATATRAHSFVPAEPLDDVLEIPHPVVVRTVRCGFISPIAFVAAGIIVGAALSHVIA